MYLLSWGTPHLLHPPGTPSLPLTAPLSPEPGDMSVQYRVELYYGCSSRGPWVSDAARRSWGSGTGHISLHKEQTGCPLASQNCLWIPRSIPAEGALICWTAELPSVTRIEIGK